jgi:hypothetical protein
MGLVSSLLEQVVRTVIKTQALLEKGEKQITK